MTSTSEISSFRMAPPPAAFYEQEGPMSQSNYAALLKTLCIAPAWKGTNFAGLEGATRIGKLPPDTPTGLRRRTGELPPHSKPGEFRPNFNASSYPPAYPTGEASKVETQRTRWLSWVNPMAGSWSLAAYPISYRPVRPGKQLPAFAPHSVGRSTSRIWRLGDFPQMIIKR